MSQVIKNYRSLLRMMRKYPSFKTSDKNLKSAITRKFRVDALETDEKVIESKRTLLLSYVELLSSVHELKHLRFLDSGDKLQQRDKINLTAKRVGFALPKVYFCFFRIVV